MKTSEVLRKAGDLLRERGWIQGSYSDAGRFCAVGAADSVAGDALGRRDPEANLLLQTVADDFPYPERYPGDIAGSMLRWNDRPRRTLDEVLAATDAAYVLALQVEGIEPGDVL